MSIALPPLNLPEAPELRLRRRDDAEMEIYDPLRQRWMVLTPEEYVRQRFVAFLCLHLGYPAALMANEVSLRLNSTLRRSDTVLYFPDGHTPRMIVEYKAPTIALTQRVFNQIARYNLTLQAPYLAVSNGLRHYCLRTDIPSSSYRFLPTFPTYSEL